MFWRKWLLAASGLSGPGFLHNYLYYTGSFNLIFILYKNTILYYTGSFNLIFILYRNTILYYTGSFNPIFIL